VGTTTGSRPPEICVMKCELCQLHLWDYLYGLLDDAALQQELTAHVQTCADCRKAWETAHAQQQLLARAARAEGTQIVFQPPAESWEVLGPPEHPGPKQAERHWGRLLLPWAIAASVLVVLLAGFFSLRQNAFDSALAAAKLRQREAKEKLQAHEQEKKQRE